MYEYKRHRDKQGHIILNFRVLSSQDSQVLGSFYFHVVCVSSHFFYWNSSPIFMIQESHVYLKVKPTQRFKFYFPPISNKRMAGTHIFEAVATLVLVTLQPQNDSSGLIKLYCVTVTFRCSKMFLLTGRKHKFMSEWKCQWMNEQHCVCVCSVCVCVPSCAC